MEQAWDAACDVYRNKEKVEDVRECDLSHVENPSLGQTPKLFIIESGPWTMPKP